MTVEKLILALAAMRPQTAQVLIKTETNPYSTIKRIVYDEFHGTVTIVVNEDEA